MSVITLSDSKWNCSACGDCCRGFSFGPVEDRVVRDLQAANIQEKWEPSRQGWVEKSLDGEWYFKHVSGHCVFLRDDNLCAIHDLMGESYKPWFCREYPFHMVREPRGVSVRVREDCGGYHKTFSSGQSIEAASEQIVSLPRLVPVQSILGRTVVIGPGLGVSPENWVQVEPMLLDRVKCARTIPEAASSIRTAINQMTGRETPHSLPYEDLYCDILKKLEIQLSNETHLPMRFKESQRILSMVLSQAPLEIGGGYTPQANDFWNVVFRGRILGKRFAALGDLPSGIGLSLFEYQLFSGRSDPTPLDDLGRTLSKWRRAIVAPPFWELIKSFKGQFSELYFSA